LSLASAASLGGVFYRKNAGWQTEVRRFVPLSRGNQLHPHVPDIQISLRRHFSDVDGEIHHTSKQRGIFLADANTGRENDLRLIDDENSISRVMI
jgi:hypothetical protein